MTRLGSQSSPGGMSVPNDYPPPGPLGATDPTAWRLDTSDEGRVKWTYRPSEDATAKQQDPQTDEAKYWLGLDLVRRPETPAAQAS